MPTNASDRTSCKTRYALEKIVNAAEIQPTDTVLEIGPGLGSLTRYLAAAAQKVIAVELDEKLLPPLEAVIAPYRNIQHRAW